MAPLIPDPITALYPPLQVLTGLLLLAGFARHHNRIGVVGAALYTLGHALHLDHLVGVDAGFLGSFLGLAFAVIGVVALAVGGSQLAAAGQPR